MRHSRIIPNEQRGLRQDGRQDVQVVLFQDWDLSVRKQPRDRRYRLSVRWALYHDSLATSIPRPRDDTGIESRIGAFMRAPTPGMHGYQTIAQKLHSHAPQDFSRLCPPVVRNLQRRDKPYFRRHCLVDNFNEASGLVNGLQCAVEGRPKSDVGNGEAVQCRSDCSLRIGEKPNRSIAPSQPLAPWGGQDRLSAEQCTAECSF